VAILRRKKPASSETSAGREQEGPALPGAGRRVLIVDDEYSARQVVGVMLEQAGFDVLQARDASDALAITRAATALVDLALIDVELAGIDGRQLATKITQLSPQTSILYMTAGPVETVGSHGGFADSSFVPRPFTDKNLIARVVNRLPT
jgi:DNA-binding response OmpR family regulator